MRGALDFASTIWVRVSSLFLLTSDPLILVEMVDWALKTNYLPTYPIERTCVHQTTALVQLQVQVTSQPKVTSWLSETKAAGFLLRWVLYTHDDFRRSIWSKTDGNEKAQRIYQKYHRKLFVCLTVKKEQKQMSVRAVYGQLGFKAHRVATCNTHTN